MANWTATLRSLAVGDGTSYPIVAPGIVGLGVPPARTADQERGHLDGDVGGDDVLPKRQITIPVGVNGTSAADAWTKFRALKTAWNPSQTNLELVLAFAGTTLTFKGRPRGVDDDLAYLGEGWINALLHFEALLPYALGESVTVSL